MIRIFPDFSVQVTATAAGGAGAGGAGGGGMVSGPPVGRVPVPVPGATNGTQQGVQGITAYQQRYVVLEDPTCGPSHKSSGCLSFKVCRTRFFAGHSCVRVQLGISNSVDASLFHSYCQ